MPPNAVASTPEVAEGPIRQRTDSLGRTTVMSRVPAESTDSLFERVAWLYAFCRERLFRDDTDRIISELWQTQTPAAGVLLRNHVMLFGPRFRSWPCGCSPALSIQGTGTASQEKRPCSTPKLSAICSGNCHGKRSEFGRMGVISTLFARKAERE